MAMDNARLEAVEQQLSYLWQWHRELISELRADQLELRATVKKEISEISQKLDQLLRNFEEIMQFAGNPNSIPIRNPNWNDRGSVLEEFPRFSGENPRSWIRKCRKYFLLNPMAESDKVFLASMHMVDEAEFFHMDYVEGKEHIGWERFSEMVLERFGDPCGENIVGAFNKLQQDGSLGMYVDKFEELKAFMVRMNTSLTEEYFVDSFLSGLKEEMRDVVRMLHPTTLTRAIQLARLQEISLQQQVKGSETETREPFIKKKLSWEETNQRRKKGLCFYCDEPDFNGHMCKKLFVVKAKENDEVEVQERSNTKVFLHALANRNSPNTIKLKGMVKEDSILIMVSTRSSHSFLDPWAATRFGYVIEYTDPLLVTVVDGHEIECNSKCSGFEWKMRGITFTADMSILKLGGCDVVLGVDFLRRMGKVNFDFDRPSITIIHEGRKVLMQGKPGERYRLVVD